MKEKLISVISSLLDIHSIFTCSIIGFRAIDYPSPACANTPLSYVLCKTCEHIYKQKLLWAHGGGGGEGNDVL